MDILLGILLVLAFVAVIGVAVHAFTGLAFYGEISNPGMAKDDAASPPEEDRDVTKAVVSDGNTGHVSKELRETQQDSNVDTIFLSYRRNDSAYVSGRIYDRLVTSYGRDKVFKDVDSIPLGVDIREYIDEVVSRASVFLAVIGPAWLGEREH